ncbi:MAG: hypothetical protein OIF50_08055 [Flavobacteriaceae bacterium]|nr:hypothetical protein [Flavobacteriaceae bacterium]
MFQVVVVVFAGGITVTLDDFSGHLEPKWKILPSNPSYNRIERLLGEARRRGFVYRSEDMPARLGYKGFLVEDALMKPKAELIISHNTVALQQV